MLPHWAVAVLGILAACAVCLGAFPMLVCAVRPNELDLCRNECGESKTYVRRTCLWLLALLIFALLASRLLRA